MAGLTPTGFEPETQENIKANLGAAFRTVFGAAITLIAQSIFGQIIGIVSERLATLWQLGLNIYTASTREGAVGIQLDHIGLLTGTPRLAAFSSKVTCQCLGDDGTVILADSVVSIPGVGTKFTNTLPGTISGGTVSIEFHSVDTGPWAAPSGTVTQIETAIAGWNSVTNALDESVLGSDVEADAPYRLRQVAELRGQGSGTTAAIRAALAAIRLPSAVTDVFVFENNGDTTNGDGLPGHTFEAVVVGGDDTVVAQTISDEKPVGIGTHGTSTVTVVDGNGFAIDIHDSRAAVLNTYVTISQTADASKYPSNGDELTKEALVTYGALNYRLGGEVRSSALIPTVFGAGLGVLECTLPLIGTAPSPGSSTTIAVNNRQKALLDTSRIVVNTTLINP